MYYLQSRETGKIISTFYKLSNAIAMKRKMLRRGVSTHIFFE